MLHRLPRHQAPSHQELEQKIQYIPYNGNSESIYSGDIFKTISFIPLETNDTCLLGTASRIIYKNAIYYIKSNNRIYLFDDKGDIIRIINRHGDGPEEYNYFWMMAVSDKGHISLFYLSLQFLFIFSSVCLISNMQESL